MKKLEDWKVAKDYAADAFDGVVVNLFELYRARLAKGQQVVTGVTFKDCRIEGPAVLLVIDGCNFDGVNFGASQGDMRNIVLHPASPTSVTGAIPLQNCAFQGGHFFGVGFTGNSVFLQQLLDLGKTQ
jgi:hypothetical protein